MLEEEVYEWAALANFFCGGKSEHFLLAKGYLGSSSSTEFKCTKKSVPVHQFMENVILVGCLQWANPNLCLQNV